MKTLALSGGASKGAFTAGVVYQLIRGHGMSFDMAVGTSTGSLVGGPALLEETLYLKTIYTTVENDDIFTNSSWGKLLKMPINASMAPLHRMLTKYYITDKKLEKLISSKKELIVSAINVRTGRVEYFSSKQVINSIVAPTKRPHITPQSFVKAILASSTEPVFTKPVAVLSSEGGRNKNDLFYDGGVKEFIPIQHAAEAGATEVWAVSTHPIKSQPSKWGAKSADRVSPLEAIKWAVSRLHDEVFHGDLRVASTLHRNARLIERLEKDRATLGLTRAQVNKLSRMINSGISRSSYLRELFLILPKSHMETSLDFRPVLMNSYFERGRKAANEFMALPRNQRLFRPTAIP